MEQNNPSKEWGVLEISDCICQRGAHFGNAQLEKCYLFESTR